MQVFVKGVIGCAEKRTIKPVNAGARKYVTLGEHALIKHILMNGHHYYMDIQANTTNSILYLS